MMTKTEKFKQSTIRGAVRTAIALSIAGAGISQPAFAAEEDEEAKSEKVVVTGSRIRRDEFASPSPIQIIKTEDAKKQGITNIADMLQQATVVNGAQIDETINTNSGNSNATEAPPAGGVGSQNVGLRGLGAERTLILVNGRRLGASGVRGAPSQPDLSLIPFEMVDRVEILSDSASAVYGADAVAGVVNIILKDSVEGMNFDASFSMPDDTGGEERQFSIVTGGQGERSSYIFGAEFYKRQRISLGERENCINTRRIDAETGQVYSYCRNGFPDNVAIIPGATSNDWAWFTPGISGSAFDGDGAVVPNWSESNDIPEPAEGWGGGADFLIDDQVGFDRFRLNPAYSDVGGRLRGDLVQPVTRFSLVTSGTYAPEWGEESSTEIFYDAMYFHRSLTNKAAIEQIYPEVPGMIPQENGQGGLLLNPDGSLQLFNNPMNPFNGLNALPVITLDDYSQDREIELDHFRASMGARGNLPFLEEKGWIYEASVSYDRGDGVATQPMMNENHLSLALDTLRLDPNGNVTCGSQIWNTDTIGGIIKLPDCVPIDFFAPSLYTFGGSYGGSFATTEERDFLMGERVNRTVVEQTLFSGFVTGDLFNFGSGGTASMVIGADYRKDTIDSQVDFLGANGLIVAENPATEGITAGSRSVQEFYTEISLPILIGAPGAEELTLDIAARTTDESNFGRENTERVRLLYSPVDWISLSTAYGTSYRAPNLREQFLGDQFSGASGFADPCNVNNAGDGWDGATQTYDPALDEREQRILDNCILQGADPTQLGSQGTTTLPVRTGGNVFTLDPETAEQVTFTLKAAPISNETMEFDFAITYFDIEIENTVQSLPAGTILQLCLNGADNLASSFCDQVGPRVGTATTAFPSFIDASFTNSGAATSKGFDLNTRFSYSFDEFMGNPLKITWLTQWTIQDELTQTLIKDESALAPENRIGTDDLVGTFGAPENRAATTLAFESGDWTLIYAGRYVDSTFAFIRDPSTSTSSCFQRNAFEETEIVGSPDVYTDCHAEAAYFSDISLSWNPQQDFSVTMGISNFTDEQPARVAAGLGSDRAGRMVGTGYEQVGKAYFLNLSYDF
ncbi:TonB-dependent receptor domain-containing protein [Pleionea sediminis]|uniref:TonB-dependent receptor domain-containing protein n=1 Tax=Pleionea sediminis TaxID=2569479 RepID=UPI001186B1B8|nr:TonB-dependent receptor [Pleionea sediminis]